MPMSRTGQNRNNRSGFTLIELIVVLVLIGVLATMTVPAMMSQMSRASLKESARRLLRTAQYARRYAIMHNRASRLVIAPEEGRYLLEHESEPVINPGQFDTLQRDGMRPATLPEGVSFGQVRIQSSEQQHRDGDNESTRARSSIMFTPSGTADAAIIVLTTDEGDNAWTLRTAPHTAHVTLSSDREDEFLSDRRDLDQ